MTPPTKGKQDTIIAIEHLDLWYERNKPSELHILKDINLEIKQGDYVAFFGPSGSGKTTLLYTIAGIDRYQSGHVYVEGKDLTGLSNHDLALFRQTGIGIIFQQFNLVPSLTVLQNVSLPMAFIGVSGEKADEEAQKLLDRLDIGALGGRYPSELSGGQQQRAGIARALANNPPIIVADEPLGNLDSVNARNVLAFLKELNEKDGRTIIMVTHEAWSLQDTKTVFYIKDGVITDTVHESSATVADSVTEHLRRELADTRGTDAHAAPENLSARMLANFMMRGYSMDEVRRFEEFLCDRLSGKIDAAQFRVAIDKPFKEGGVGLWKKKAERLSRYVEEVIEHHHDVDAVRLIIEKHPELPITEEARRIRTWLLDGLKLHPSEDQRTALDAAVSDRLRNTVGTKEFFEKLNRSVHKNGVGLSFRASERLLEKMESIIMGGIEIQSSVLA